MIPKVGDKLLEYDLRFPEKKPTEVEVFKVGRLYFYTTGMTNAYRLDDFRPKGWSSGDIKLFRSVGEFNEYEAKGKLDDVVCNFFRGYGSSGLSYSQLKRVDQIIKEEQKSDGL